MEKYALASILSFCICLTLGLLMHEWPPSKFETTLDTLFAIQLFVDEYPSKTNDEIINHVRQQKDGWGDTLNVSQIDGNILVFSVHKNDINLFPFMRAYLSLLISKKCNRDKKAK